MQKMGYVQQILRDIKFPKCLKSSGFQRIGNL